MKQLFRVLAVCLLVMPGVSLGQSFTGRVVGVTDGDTLSVMRNGAAVKIRLYGIDCPEKGQPFTNRAKQFVSDLAFGKEVKVEAKGQDRYGRTIGEVFLPDGTNLNREVVKAGFAWWFRRYAPNDSNLERLETKAREAGRGLWADREPIPPWEWRKLKIRR